MSYLKDAIKLSLDLKPEERTPEEVVLTADEAMLADALKKANEKFGTKEITEDSEGYTKLTADKGLYGGKTCKFTTDVYKLDKNGDVSSRAGLVTPADLESHIRFRKGDQLTFQWKCGEAGACTYTAKGNGQDDFNDEFKWTDKLIRELVDEGSLKEE